MSLRFQFGDIVRQTFQTLWSHKLRTFLSMFGITWGVMSLLLLGAMGEGLRIGQRQRMANLGKDLIFIFGGRVSIGVNAAQSERWVTFTETDCRMIVAQCPAVASCTPIINRGNIRAESPLNNVAFEVFGILPNYQGIRFMPLDRGRLLNDEDISEGRRVVVIGEEVRKQLFPQGNAIGQRVRLDQVPFDVVGTLALVGREGNSGTNARLFIPLETMRRYFPHRLASLYSDAISFMMVQPVHPDLHKQAVDQYRVLLAKRHNFSADDPSALDQWDTIENFRLVDRIFQAMDVFLGSVGIVTLALGAIGVMNIMLVSVSERTREIGVRKALGATHRDILLQFFLEGLVLTASSGGFGLFLGWGISQALQGLPFPEGFAPPTVTWRLGLIAVFVLSLVALAATLIPARRAALLPPAEAVRIEA